jgi:hypothetical protein
MANASPVPPLGSTPGGIVVYQGICYSKAVEQGIETAALPINMQLNTSRVS